VFAQESNTQFSNALPPEILGPQLVVWSQLQKPHPVPQPLPPPERADQTDSAQTDASQAQEQPSTQSFTGTIVKDGGKYLLKVSETSAYQIDDQQKARLYEGKQVRIAGSLDPKNNILHITSIELIS
jgi:hypothetical protein